MIDEETLKCIVTHIGMNTGKRGQTIVKIEIVIQMAKDRYFEYKYMLFLCFFNKPDFFKCKISNVHIKQV